MRKVRKKLLFEVEHDNPLWMQCSKRNSWRNFGQNPIYASIADL